jgi:hypothetical protein
MHRSFDSAAKNAAPLRMTVRFVAATGPDVANIKLPPNPKPNKFRTENRILRTENEYALFT